MSSLGSSRDVMAMGPEIVFRERIDSLTRGNARAALQHFRQALRISKKRGDQNNTAWSLLHIAMVLRSQRQHTSVLQILEEARQIFISVKNDYGVAAVYQELSLANRELDRNALALEYAHQSIKMFQELNRTIELAWTYDNMAYIHFNLFHRPESLTYAKKARAIFTEFNSQNGVAWNACNLALLYMEMGFYSRAERYYSEAIKIFTTLKNKQGLGWGLLGLATVYRTQARYEGAMSLLARAKVIFKELQLKDRYAWCLLHEAAIHRVFGKEDEAIAVNKKAIQIFSPLRNHDGVAWGLFQTGQIMRDHGQFVKAWQTLREGLNLHTDIANRKGIGWAENEWGKTYLELNDQSHARDCFIRSKVTAEQLDDGPLKIEVNKNLARLHLEEGLLQRADSLLKNAENLSHKIKARETQVEIYLERARYCLIIGEISQARQWVRSANTLSGSYNLLRLKPSIGVFLGEILMAEGKTEQAIKVWNDVINLLKKFQQRRQRTEALLGLVQALSRSKTPSQLAVLLYQIEKDVRALSSRKLKAKFLLVRGYISYLVSGHIDIKYFNQSLQIMESAGLAVLERQVLSFMADLYRRAGMEKEAKQSEADIQTLLEQGSVDLYLVRSRTEDFPSMPISITT